MTRGQLTTPLHFLSPLLLCHDQGAEPWGQLQQAPLGLVDGRLGAGDHRGGVGGTRGRGRHGIRSEIIGERRRGRVRTTWVVALPVPIGALHIFFLGGSIKMGGEASTPCHKKRINVWMFVGYWGKSILESAQQYSTMQGHPPPPWADWVNTLGRAV